MKLPIIVCLVLLGGLLSVHAADAVLPRVAILAITDANEGMTDRTATLTDIIFVKLSSLPSISLVERAEIDKLLKEKELNLSAFANTDQTIKLGQILGADYIFTGRIYPFSHRWVFNGKLIHCKTGKVKGCTSNTAQNQEEDALISTFAGRVDNYMKEQFNDQAK